MHLSKQEEIEELRKKILKDINELLEILRNPQSNYSLSVSWKWIDKLEEYLKLVKDGKK